MKEKDRLLRVDQLAQKLNISKRQAYRLISNGHFVALKIGGCLRIRSDSVEDYVKRQISLFAIENGIRD